jgi:hypothetical protein
VGIDVQAAEVIAFGGDLFGQRTGTHTGRPDHRPRVDAQVDSWMNDRREKKGTSSAQASDDQLIQITDISS